MIVQSQGRIAHRYFSQDPIAEQLMTTDMPADGVSVGPENDRLKVDDGQNPVAAPDENGNMLYPPTDPRFDQVQTFAAARRSLSFFQRHLGREPEWAFGREQMLIHPHAGNTINAYYNRQEGSINFYTHHDTELGKVINSGHSAEVVCHEAGHALLDGVRPEWLNCLEDATGGFHESLGDVVAFLVAMEEPRNLDKLILETGGDLKRHNSVAKLAEEVSRALWDELNVERPHHDYLRNAINPLINADPRTLPLDPPDENQLGRAVHNYARVMTGAMWDVLDSLNRQNQAQGLDNRASLERARDRLAALFVRSLDFAPVGHLPSYGHIVQAMLEVDRRDFGGQHAEMLVNLFRARNIHPPATLPVPALCLPEDPRCFLESHREELGVGQTPLEFSRSYRNDRGETFLVYRYDRPVPVEGGARALAQGGLLLVFDPDGKLSYRHFNEITPEVEATLAEAVQAQMAQGAIRTDALLEGPPSSQDLLQEDGRPYQGYLAAEQGEVWVRASPVRA
ncbi:MAG: hypothetical protein AB1758_17360 [Candidatus Eremiobacterota bacterium]